IFVQSGSTADIYVATKDVTHGVNIAGTNFNLMAIPGAVNYRRVKFDKAGDFLVVCNEYCGAAHHQMAGVIHVTDRAAPPAPAPAPGTQSPLEANGCTACHSLDGTKSIGPTFKGLYGSRQTLTDGSTAVADNVYLRKSIAKPNTKIVKNYEPSMPEL